MAAEIISTVERRRNWRTEVKLRIMEEAVAPGACIAAVADRNGVCRSLLYSWLRLARLDHATVGQRDLDLCPMSKACLRHDSAPT